MTITTGESGYRVAMRNWRPMPERDGWLVPGRRGATPGPSIRLEPPAPGRFRIGLTLRAEGMDVLRLRLRLRGPGGTRWRDVFLDVAKPGALLHDLDRVTLVTTAGPGIFDLEMEGSSAEDETLHAVSLDPSSAICHAFWAWALLCNNDRVGAVRAGGRGAALNPGDPAVLATYALALSYDGNLDEARANFDQARRLEPVPPFWFGEFEAVAAFAEGRYADCLDGVEPVTDAAWDIMYSLACYGHLGLQEKARGVLARMARMGADFDFDTGAAHEPFRDPEVSSRLREGLARALAWRER